MSSASLQLSAKKSLGQNFILDLNLTRRIARAAGPLEGATVVEVGAGPGGLTRALLLEGAGRVMALERDERCLPALQAIAARHAGRLDIHIGDALDARLGGACRRQQSADTVIAANLPYNIATRLLIGWLESRALAALVAAHDADVPEGGGGTDRAEPGTKAYGRLAVISQWRTQPRMVMTLGPEAFTPPPAVASAVVEFVPRPAPEPACSVATLGRVTAAAFGQRRKMLRQSLKSLGAGPCELLAAAGMAPELRAEQLTVCRLRPPARTDARCGRAG